MPTHGSLTKAGKVRAQTPKIEGNPKKSPIPRKRNRLNFHNRIQNTNMVRYNQR